MYIFKEEKRQEIIEKYKMTYLCNQVGLTKGYFSQIINGKKTCPKRTAYSITKYFDSDAEIEDYFNINK